MTKGPYLETLPSVDCSQGLSKKPKSNPIMHLRLESKMAAFPFFSFCSALLAISLGIFVQFNAKQSKPYMDEIFHVPQAQKYCHYKFQDWDPKITTLPGIYLFSFLCLRALSYFLGQELLLLCSTFLLRMTNVLFLVGNVWILRQLLICIHSHCDKKSAQEQKEVGIDFF